MRGWTLLLSSASSCLRSHAFTTSSMMRWPRNLSTTITNPIPSSSSSMRLRLLRQQLKLQHHHHQHHPSSNNANPLQHVFRFLSTTRVHSLSQQPSPNPPNNNNNNNTSNHRNLSNDTTLYYIGSIIVFFVGLSYAAVPLYQILCTQTGIDGTPVTALTNNTTSDPAKMVPVKGARPIRISFDASTSDTMRWQFTPVTRSMHVLPGETALAFFVAKNPTDEDIVGISTYSVVPAKAAQYFNKIQCFCFEEQMLAANEEVDMPVFFYIDPEFASDPWMRDVNQITLHYTFFKSKVQQLGKQL